MPGGGGLGNEAGVRGEGSFLAFCCVEVMQRGVHQRHGPDVDAASFYRKQWDRQGRIQAQMGGADINLHAPSCLERLLQKRRGEGLRCLEVGQGRVYFVLRGPALLHRLFERRVLLAAGVCLPVGNVQWRILQGLALVIRGACQPGRQACVKPGGYLGGGDCEALADGRGVGRGHEADPSVGVSHCHHSKPDGFTGSR